MNKKSIGYIVLAIIFFYLLVVQVNAIWLFTIDDMFIPLRYARNWAYGHGLLWNIQELPVEGYSNFSFVVIAALAIKAGINPVVLLKILGVAGLYLTVWAIFLLSRLWFVAWVACLPSIALLVYKGQIIWSVSGLETTIYQALLAFSLYFLLRGQGYQPFPSNKSAVKHPWYLGSALCLALASFTRPEAPFFLLLFFTVALFDSDKSQRKAVYLGLLKATLFFALLYVPYFVWRLYYFGRILPNSVLCKGFVSNTFFLLDASYLYLAWPFVILAMVAIIHARDRRHWFFWTPSVLYMVLLMKADPLVAFDSRLFLPAFQFLLPLSLVGLSKLTTYIWERDNFVLGFTAFLTGFFFLPAMTPAEYRFFSNNPQAGIHLRQNVLAWLSVHAPENSRVVLADSGMIPYMGKQNYIDSSCLNNRQMTEQVDAKMYERFCERVLKEKPEVIILSAWLGNNQIIQTPGDSCLSRSLINNANYPLKAIFETSDQQSIYRYSVYVYTP